VLEQWGLPQCLRVDNGHPWGAHGHDLPTPLALWLTGLGIELCFNPPSTPTANGLVERLQGVLQGWAESQRCTSCQQLQNQLDWCVRIQRECYTSETQKQTHLHTHPQLYTNPRIYRRQQEVLVWQVDRVWALLSHHQWERRVDKVGRISWYGTAYSVGRRFAHQHVYLHLDLADGEWVVSTEQGSEIKRWSAWDIVPLHLLNFVPTDAHPLP
jgi:hypothetical protein